AFLTVAPSIGRRPSAKRALYPPSPSACAAGPRIRGLGPSIDRRPTIRPAGYAVAALRCSHSGLCSAPATGARSAGRGGREGPSLVAPATPSGRLVGRVLSGVSVFPSSALETRLISIQVALFRGAI